MISPIEYIKDNLNQLANLFPSICFKYGYDEIIKSHIIEITPEEEFYNLEKLQDKWIEFSVEFMNKFPLEDIVFISSDSTLALDSYSFSCNSQSEYKLQSVFFEEFLSNEMKIDYSTSVTIDAAFEPVNLIDQPFHQIDKEDFDSNELLMAA